MSQKNYSGAISTFEKLQDILRIIDNRIRIDAAHAYFNVGDSTMARVNYEIIQDVGDIELSSVARNQLGVLALIHKDSTKAIRFFKSAIEKNSQLDAARYNYELISRLYKPNTAVITHNQESESQIVGSDERERTLNTYVSEVISMERAVQLLDNLREFENKGLTTIKNSSQKVEKDW